MLQREGYVMVDPLTFVEKYPVLKDLFGLFEDKILVERLTDDVKEDVLNAYVLTIECKYNRRYTIYIQERKNGHISFVSGFTCREERPFETWQRGNDMVDGKLTKTVINIFIKEVIDDLFAEAPSKYEDEPWQGVQETHADAEECEEAELLVDEPEDAEDKEEDFQWLPKPQECVIVAGEHMGERFELTTACRWTTTTGVLWNLNTKREEGVEGDIVEYTLNGIRYRGHVVGYTCYQFIETKEWGLVCLSAHDFDEHNVSFIHLSEVEMIKEKTNN